MEEFEVQIPENSLWGDSKVQYIENMSCYAKSVSKETTEI